MKTFRQLLTLSVTASLSVSTTLMASEQEMTQPESPFATVTNQPGLPSVLLIGDSISIGYTLPVRRLLRGKANVHRIPENGGPTTNGLAKLQHWLGGEHWDVIHFNWGLHDLKIMPDGKHQVSLEVYENSLQELVRQLKATGAKLIWATTIPVPPEEDRLKVKRRAADVPRYNAVALEIMQTNQIEVDDLYAFALPRLTQIQQPADVHYTAEGYRELATQVAASIEKFLPAKKSAEATAR
jgi:GDSL-like Lipase/Acylhydrolase family